MNPYCYREGKAVKQSPIDIIDFPRQIDLNQTYFLPIYKKLNVRAQYFNYSLMVTPEDYSAFSGDIYTRYPNDL